MVELKLHAFRFDPFLCPFRIPKKKKKKILIDISKRVVAIGVFTIKV